MEEESWSVLKTDFRRLDLSTCAAVMARNLDMLALDASARLRASRGILARGLPRPAAESTARELNQAGIHVAAAPDSFTTSAPSAYQLRNANATKEAFVPIKDTTTGPASLPWTQVQVIAAGRVVEREWRPLSSLDRRLQGAADPIRRIGMAGAASTVEETHTRDRVVIVGAAPPQHYVIDSKRFNYGSILPQPLPVAEANYCVLVRGLIQMCPQAATNILPQHLAAGGGVALETFHDSHDLDRLVQWLYSLVRLDLWPAATAGAAADISTGPGPTDDRTVQQ